MKTIVLFVKLVFLLVLVCSLSVSSFAQKHIDVIKLKNGNVLKGKIVRQVPGKFVELKTTDKNFWKFDMEDIAEIRFESKRKPKFVSDTIPEINKGGYFDVRMGVLAGNNNNQNDAPFSLLGSANFFFTKRISVGVGAGYEAFEEAQLPVFGELKCHGKIKGLHTYVFCQSGYSFSLDDRENGNYYYYVGDKSDTEGGWLINPGVGFVFGNRLSPRFSLNIGYRFQEIKHKWYNQNRDDTEYLKEEFNRLSIHLGIIF